MPEVGHKTKNMCQFLLDGVTIGVVLPYSPLIID